MLVMILRHIVNSHEKEEGKKFTKRKMLFIKITIISIIYWVIIYSIAKLDLYWMYGIILKSVVHLIHIYIVIITFIFSFIIYFYLLNIFSKKEVKIILTIQLIVLIVLLLLFFYFDFLIFRIDINFLFINTGFIFFFNLI